MGGASRGGRSPTDAGDAGIADAAEAGIPAAGCETAMGGAYVVTSQGHVFYTGGNATSSAWTAVTVAGGRELDHAVISCR